jgi:hypothetical protein
MPIKQEQYVHAMAEDTETGKPMPKVAATLTGSNIAQPVDIQARLSQTIQTHSGVSVAPSGNSAGNYASTWIDCDGFDKIGITLNNDAATSSNIDIYWSNDNSAIHGREQNVIPSGTLAIRAGITDVKARYARVYVFNNDAAPHTFSAWAYLKA